MCFTFPQARSNNKVMVTSLVSETGEPPPDCDSMLFEQCYKLQARFQLLLYSF